MAFSAAHLSALEAAAASGVLTVRDSQGRTTTYQSLEHLLKAIEVARRDQASAASASTSTRRYGEHGRGY